MTSEKDMTRLFDRRELLCIGVTGVVTLMGFGAALSGRAYANTSAVTSMPALEEGPYWIDETGTAYHRSDLRANTDGTDFQEGLPLFLGLTVSQYDAATGTVTPLPNAFVYTWSANPEGVYSGEASQGSSGDSYQRGYQVTGAHGTVQFLTNYPGWYAGRTVHIHLRVRLYPGNDPTRTPTYDFESQIFFDDAITAAVYANVAPYNTRASGRDTFNDTDRVYTGGSLDADGVTGDAGALTTVRLADDRSHAVAQYHMVLNLSLSEPTGVDSGGTSPTGGTGGMGGAPSGTVISVGTDSFVIRDSSGTDITVDIVSGTTYQYTTASTPSAAAVGGYVAGQGSVSNGQLLAVDLAFVPEPPSFVPSYDIETTPQGTICFGQITAVQGRVITVSTGDTSQAINTASATNVTLTTNSGFQAIRVGETVEVNGPEVSPTEYTGHQLNIGLTPAVVGQFD